MAIFRPVTDIGREVNTRIFSEPIIPKVLERLGIKKLRPIQREAICKGLFMGMNFLICTPSGSGKTLIAELAILHNLLTGNGSAVYLVPYRALAAEKHRHFQSNYGRYGFKIVLSIGDSGDEIPPEDTDILITTFEKLDSLLRNGDFAVNFAERFGTAVFDEIHVMGDPERGYRIEYLLMRLITEFFGLQIICLSATISNPENFKEWMNTLSLKFGGTGFEGVFSDKRPVELDYRVEISRNKDSFIRKKIKECLKEGGQVLLFFSSRSATVKNAVKYSGITSRFLDEKDRTTIDKKIAALRRLPGHSPELLGVLRHGIAFHNAGLLPEERHTVESLYIDRRIKVICCTTTLAAGVNTPARLVILRDIKRKMIPPSVPETVLTNLYGKSEIHELPGSFFGHFIPFPNNQTFQLLGRAGRPGLDDTGIGIILTSNENERDWVIEKYFTRAPSGKLEPKYNPIKSGFDRLGALRELVLLTVYLNEGISRREIAEYFGRSYFIYNYDGKIPPGRYLLINARRPEDLLELHGSRHKNPDWTSVKNMEIERITGKSLTVVIDTGRLYRITIDADKGVRCSCGFSCGGAADERSDNVGVKSDYKFCNHITALLSYTAKFVGKRDICNKIYGELSALLPRAIGELTVIDYLITNGFITELTENVPPRYKITGIGKLALGLYIRPSEFIKLRKIYESFPFKDVHDYIEAGCMFLRQIGRWVGDGYEIMVDMWIKGKYLGEILKVKEEFGAGDFYAFRDDLARSIGHIGAIAGFEGVKYIVEDVKRITRMVAYGVNEEMLPLTELNGLSRKYLYALYRAGITSLSGLTDHTPHTLSSLTGIPLRICRTILKYVAEKYAGNNIKT